jgi:tRNA dimethylallyltransferase
MPSWNEGPATGHKANYIVRSPSQHDNARKLTPRLPVIVVLGATATGKTAFAVQLAQEVNGEIINADSRYLYLGMTVGTAKPTVSEMGGIPHHLIDVLEPTDDYSLARFLDDAYAAVELVATRARVPIVTGGTPQYVRGFIEGWQAPAVPPNSALRAELERQPVETLFVRLQSLDPQSAERIDPHNKRRMIRALEVQAATGTPMSALQSKSPPPYQMHLIGLRQPRELLYPRIEERVRGMFAAGWLDEVRGLATRGATAATPAMSAHGYREALAVTEGTMSAEQAIEQTAAMVRRYVRHQETWFRRFSNVTWYDSTVDGYEQFAIADARSFLQRATSGEFDRLTGS